MKNRLLSSIFLVVFIDLLGFSLILPLLPYYAASFNADGVVIGLMVASYAAAQFLATPFLGRLSDRFGRRPILMISILGNAIGFFMLGFANGLPMLFVSRIVSGLFGGNISVAQAYISDITDSSNRAKGLGLIGAAFGLGFIIGPAAGGLLSQWGYGVPSLAAAGISMLNLVMVALWLPESLTLEKRTALGNANRTPFTPKALLDALRRPLVGPLLHTRFFFALAFSTFQTIFALYGLRKFNLSAQETGYILGYVGVLSVIVQGFLIGKLTARFSDRSLIFFSTILMAVGLFGWAFSPSVLSLLIDLVPIALAGGVLNTVINSALSKSVSPVEVGGTLGLSASLESLTRMISPTFGGILLEKIGTSAPGIFSGLILIWLAFYVFRFVYRYQEKVEPVPTVARTS